MINYFRNPVLIEKDSIERAMREAAPYVGGIVVDIGCGEKPYARLFDNVRAYIGCDMDLGNNKQADVCADSLYLPFKNASVDTVITNQVIEHVKRPEVFMQEIARVMKPGAALVLTAPQLWCLHEKPHDYYRFTRYVLELLCRENNLDVLVLRERDGAFAAIGQMLSLMIYLPQSHNATRTHLVRPLFGFAQLFFGLLDRLFFNPDLTLGYLLVARKSLGA